MQNKLHYATHGHTAAELTFQRADAEQEFMGLRSFSGAFPVKRDVEIAAIEHRPMYMADYIRQFDAILSSGGRALLTDAGTVSHAAAIEKAHSEYRKYQRKTLTPVEKAYLDTVKAAEKEVKAEARKRKGHA